MLPPYPNFAHHFISQEETPSQNPTSFFMSTTSLDHYDHFNSETLEAVLRPPPAMAAAATVVVEPINGVADDERATEAPAAPRRRPFRTDRHSKIRTAQGVRDRRMRLSVGVARDFFALQDRLGFDKASETVDWLLTQSKPAIDRLPPAAVAAAGNEKAEASFTSSGSGSSAKDARERTVEKMRSGGGGRHAPVDQLMEEHGAGELDWLTSGPAAAADLEQQMEGLEYYYYCQYYQPDHEMLSRY